MYVRGMSGPALTDALTALGAAYEAVDAADIDTLTAPQILAALDQIESLGRRLPVQWHRLLGRLQAETTPRELGAKSWKDVLAIRWCVSTTEAHRRLTAAAELGPRQALTGTPLPPLLPAVAVAQAAGVLTPEHVAVLRSVLRKVPGFVDAPTRAQIEVDLVGTGIGVSPQALKNAGLLDDDSGWATQINARNEVEWLPPEHLDTGQARVNYHHRPEELLRPPDNPPPPDSNHPDTNEPRAP